MANITYRQVNDYMIPNLKLPHEESDIRLGKWGMIYKDYLRKHKKTVFSTLLAEGNLYQHCAEVEKQADEITDQLIKLEMNKKNISQIEELEIRHETLEWLIWKWRKENESNINN